MFDRILLAVDGTDPATTAARHGLTLGAAVDAHVDIVYVLEEPRIDRKRGDVDTSERGETVLEAATTIAADHGVAVDTHLLDGPVHHAIAAHARDHDVDLVAMGRHGRSGAGERLLGTVTDRVLRTVDRPVLTVGAADTPTTYRNVLVPTDGSDAAERALPYGAAVAEIHGAGVHLLNVADVQAAAGVFDVGGVSREFVDRVRERGQDAVDRLADRVDTDIEVMTAVVRGTPHAEIGAYAGDHDIDVVVMGSTGASTLSGQTVGSVANRVVRTVEQPVLIVPD